MIPFFTGLSEEKMSGRFFERSASIALGKNIVAGNPASSGTGIQDIVKK